MNTHFVEEQATLCVLLYCTMLLCKEKKQLEHQAKMALKSEQACVNAPRSFPLSTSSPGAPSKRERVPLCSIMKHMCVTLVFQTT